MDTTIGMAAESPCGPVVEGSVYRLLSQWSVAVLLLVVGQIALGSEALYQQHCAGCHGAQAEGTDKGPPLLHRGYAPKHHSDTAFRRAMEQGVQQHHWNFGDMPAQSQLEPGEIESLLEFLRAQQRSAGIP